MNNDLNDNLCLSGGADGADLQWGMTAGSAGMTVIHWTFREHRHQSQAPAAELVELNQQQLAEADPYCQKANLTLQRRFPTSSVFGTNLLRRNWYQVRDAQACYAITEIKNGIVQGGTAWAVQMFKDRFNGEPCPAYVFCQTTCHWFEWTGTWSPIYEPPKPSGIFAGVGTRNLSLTGKLAIRVLMDYKSATNSARV